MKRWKLVDIIINYIYHDNIYLGSPIVDWDLMNILNKQFKENYHKIRPVLLEWEKKGYITLVENNEIILVFHPEKLPSKQQLIKESEI